VRVSTIDGDTFAILEYYHFAYRYTRSMYVLSAFLLCPLYTNQLLLLVASKAYLKLAYKNTKL